MAMNDPRGLMLLAAATQCATAWHCNGERHP